MALAHARATDTTRFQKVARLSELSRCTCATQILSAVYNYFREWPSVFSVCIRFPWQDILDSSADFYLRLFSPPSATGNLSLKRSEGRAMNSNNIVRSPQAL